MRKHITRIAALVAVSLVLVACGGGGSSVGLETEENGRKYHAFALATSFNNAPDFYQYHSRNIQPWGEGSSVNTVRFASDRQDELLETMRYASAIDGQADFKAAFLEYVKLWNEELPELPLYANEYHDLYNGNNLQNFKTGPLWQWRESIVEATTPNADVKIGVSSDWNGDFIVGWTNSAYDEDVRTLVFGSGLLVGDENGAMTENYMTEKVDVSEDQKTWTFKLKEDIKWSDGEPFTADDVIFTYLLYTSPTFNKAGGSLDRTKLPETYVGWEEFEAAVAVDPAAEEIVWDDAKLEAALANFDGFKKLDDYTVQFNLVEAEFNTWGGFEAQDILPEHYYSNDGKVDAEHVRNTLMAKPLGSGPYVMTEYVPGQSVKFEVNPLYPGNINGVKPQIPSIIYKRTANETDVDELLAGGVDLLAGQIQGTKIDPVKAAEAEGFTYNTYARHGYGHLSFHTDFGPSQFKEIRQAFAFGIDREEFIKEFTGGYAVTLDGPYSLPFVKPEAEYDANNPWEISEKWISENLTDYKKDPEKAIETLEAAGWTKGSDGIYEKEVDGKVMKAVVGLAAGSQDWADALNLSTGKMEKEIGIKVIVEPIEFAVLIDHYYGNKVQ